MGKNNKERVQFVISHFEGSSGNFLGYLVADQMPAGQDFFRIDVKLNSTVLSINGRNTWHQEIEQHLDKHSVVVTHNYEKDLIACTFPNAKIVQIYPYTNVGNVLYNICSKKLDLKIPNQVDNHLINLREWHSRLTESRPLHDCHDFASLRQRHEVEKMLGIRLNTRQDEFFNQYWQRQICYRLDLPKKAMSIRELVDFWQIQDFFNSWSVAWTIFAFERCHCFAEADRLWSIDDTTITQNWKNLSMIENLYQNPGHHVIGS